MERDRQVDRIRRRGVPLIFRSGCLEGLNERTLDRIHQLRRRPLPPHQQRKGRESANPQDGLSYREGERRELRAGKLSPETSCKKKNSMTKERKMFSQNWFLALEFSAERTTLQGHPEVKKLLPVQLRTYPGPTKRPERVLLTRKRWEGGEDLRP